MPLYKGGSKIKNLYIGGRKIKELYKGGTKVFSSGLPIGTVIFESSTPGNYTVTLPESRNYNIICVGGGGGAASVSTYRVNSSNQQTAVAVAGGGSGGYSQSTVSLMAGTHSIQVGGGGAGASGYNGTGQGTQFTGNTGGSSAFDNVVLAYPGGGGYAYAKSASNTHDRNATAGSGGSGTTADGNAGGTDSHGSKDLWSGTVTASGGSSVYGGYGAGGSASAKGLNDHPTANSGGSGYVRIVTA